MEPIVDQLVLEWIGRLRSQFSEKSNMRLCDIGRKIQFLTVDIITKVCLGDEIGCIKNDRDMHRLLETVETGNRSCQYFSVFLELNTLFFQLAKIPPLRGLIFPKPGDETGVGRLMGVSSYTLQLIFIKYMLTFNLQIVHDAVQKRAKDGHKSGDVVGSLLDRGMSPEQINSELVIAL